MPAAADRLEFAPPPQPGAVRAFVLAILAHVLLMLALTWGITWNRESENIVAEAELWSAVPQQAAPRAADGAAVVQAPPLPTTPAPPPPVAPKVASRRRPRHRPRRPTSRWSRKRSKQEQAERRQEELERQKKLEARKKQELEQKKLEARKSRKSCKQRELAEHKAAEEKKRKEEQVKAAKAKAREQEEAKQLAAMRQENLDRMQGLAGATGAAGCNRHRPALVRPLGQLRRADPARVRPHIVFTDDISGNPTAEVEVRMAPDGTIVSRRLVKSSGVSSWDEAVLRALDKTEVLPRDVDGRVHTPLTIEFRPKT